MNAENDTPPQSLPQSFPDTPPKRKHSLWPVVALAALGLSGWQWWDAHQRFARFDETMARQQAEAESAAKDASSDERRQIETLTARLATLEGRFAEFGEQGEALNRDLARSREEATLIEVEQAITLASQQLQLAGNVPVALLALQTADTRLAHLDRPQLLPLRKALAKDIERLNTMPFVDVPGLSLRLEQAVAAIDRLPLAARGRPGKSPKNEEAPAQEGWRGVLGSIGQELRGLVRIERFDGEGPALVAPEQEFFLRENLKLRLLNSRLALLSRDATTLRSELKVAREWLGRYFVTDDKGVQSMQTLLGQAQAADVGAEMPDLAQTLAALRTARTAKDKR
jgi:uroporphyrin-3 C-methyltransferase